MPLIVVTKPFAFAHHGYQVEEFAPSEKPIETTEECAEIAIREGWAKAPEAVEAPAVEEAPKAVRAKKPAQE